VRRDNRIASAAAVRSSRTSVRSLASIATSVPAAHRDAEIGLGERRGVVDPVADHRDDPALGLQLGSTTATLSAGITSARTSSMPTSAATTRRSLVVAGEQHRFEPELAEPATASATSA
jgi:hypothetical protein